MVQPLNGRPGTGPMMRPPTQPLPPEVVEQVAPPAPPPKTPIPATVRDTSELRTPQQAEAPEEVEIDSIDKLGSELLDGFNEKLQNSALDKGRGLLNVPGVIAHAVQVGQQIARNPGAIGDALQNAVENPLEAAEAAGEAISEVKDGVEALGATAEVIKDAAGATIKNVRDHGLVKGAQQSLTDARDLAVKHAAEIQENFRSDSGAGLSNLAREVAEQTADRTEKQVTKALMREVYSDPDLAPKGFVGGVKRLLNNASGVVDGVTGKVVDFADNLADKAADALANNAVGRKVLDALDFVNPARHVSADALAAATKTGTAEGLQAAGEAVTQTLQKAGHTVVTDGAGTITKVVSSTGKEVAMEAFEAATKEGLELAAKEAGQLGATAAAKGLGRFAPGVNIAIAAYDTYHAAEVWADPNSTGWQKGMATVTAVGSVLAATNIPVVSQVGAAVSLATSVLENVSPQMLADAGKAVAGATVKAAKAVGDVAVKAVRTVAEAPAKAVKAVAAGATKVANAVTAGATQAARAVTSTVSSAAGAVASGAKSAAKAVGNFFGGLFGG